MWFWGGARIMKVQTRLVFRTAVATLIKSMGAKFLRDNYLEYLSRLELAGSNLVQIRAGYLQD